VREMLREQLDRHPALEAQVHGEVHRRHAAVPEPAFEAIAPADLVAHLPLPSEPPAPLPSPPSTSPAGGPPPVPRAARVVTGPVGVVVVVVGWVTVGVVTVGVVTVAVVPVVPVVTPPNGCAHRARACLLRLAIPSRSLLRRAPLTVTGRVLKSRSVLAIA